MGVLESGIKWSGTLVDVGVLVGLVAVWDLVMVIVLVGVFDLVGVLVIVAVFLLLRQVELFASLFVPSGHVVLLHVALLRLAGYMMRVVERLAPVRLARFSFALPKSAPDKLAFLRKAPCISAFLRKAPFKFEPARLAPTRIIPCMFTPEKVLFAR